MPKINQSAQEKADDTAAHTALEGEAIPEATKHTSFPTLVASVNRKVNVGNYESIDVHCSLTMPVDGLPQELGLDEFKRMVADAAELGFNVCSHETGQRYTLIKDGQRPSTS